MEQHCLGGANELPGGRPPPQSRSPPPTPLSQGEEALTAKMDTYQKAEGQAEENGKTVVTSMTSSLSQTSTSSADETLLQKQIEEGAARERKLEADNKKLSEYAAAREKKLSDDSATREQKLKGDKQALWNRINELRQAVDAATHARIKAEKDLKTSMSSSQSHATSSSEDILHKQIEDGAAREKKLSDDAAAREEKFEVEKKKLSDDASAREKKLSDESVAREKKFSDDAAAREKKLSDDAIAREKKFSDDAAAREKKLSDDATVREQKLKGDKRYLRERINELRQAVDASTHARVKAEEDLKTSMSSSLSHATSASEENLQRQIEEGAAREHKLVADQDLLRKKIAELEGEVNAAVQSKALADEKLRMSETSSHTTSSSEEQLQKQVGDAMAEKIELLRKMAALQEQVDAAALSKVSSDEQNERHKASMDEAGALRQELELKISDLRQEVEEAIYSKFLVDQELAKEQKRSSDSGSASEEHMSMLRKMVEDLKSKGKADADVAAQKLAALMEELGDVRAKKKSHDNEAAAREMKLQQDLYDMIARKKVADDDSAAFLEKLLGEKDALRTRLQTVQEEVDEAAFAKLFAAGEHKAAMAAAVAKEEELKRKLQSLKEEVETAVYAKHLADEELVKVKASSSSQASDEMTTQLKDQASALRDQKAAFDAREKELMEKLQSLQEEVEVVTYAKHIAETELGKVRSASESQAASSVSDELTEQVKVSQDRVTTLEKQKAVADALENELKQKVQSLQLEVEAALQGKLTAETERDQAKSSGGSQATGSDSDGLAVLREQKASADSAYGTLKRREETLLGELNALRAYANQTLMTERKRGNDLMEKVARMEASTASQTTSSSEEQEQEMSELRKQMLELIAEKKAVVDDAAARKKIDADDIDALNLQLRALQEKMTSKKLGHKAAMDGALAEVKELRDKLKSVEGEVQLAVFAKHLAETEMGKAMASSSNGCSFEEQISLLRKELYDSKVDNKVREDESTAREDSLRSQLFTIKEEADKAAKTAADAALAKEAELGQKVKFLQEEVESAFFAKHEAEKEAAMARSSSASGGSASDAQFSMLQKEVQDLKAEKKAAKADADAQIRYLKEKMRSLTEEVDLAVYAKHVAEDELVKAKSSSASSGSSSEAQLQKDLMDLRASKKAADDDAADREIKLRAEKDALRARLQTVQEEADEAAYLKLLMAGEHKAAVDKVTAKEEGLQRKLQSLQKEVEDALHAKHVVDMELDKMKASSSSQISSSVDEEMVAQMKEQVAALQDQKASADAREEELAEKLRSLQEEIDSAVYAKHVAESELDKMKTYSASQTSSEAQELADELQAAKADAAAVKRQLELDKDDLEKRIKSLQELASQLATAKDDAATKKRVSDDLLCERIESLQKDVRAAVTAKIDAETQLKAFKDSSGSETSSEFDAMKEQRAADESEKKSLKDLLKTSNDSLFRLREEMGVLRQQATILSSGKRVAEEELRALKSSSEGGSSIKSGSSSDAILLKQIEQLKAEKKLSRNLAALMKRRLDADKQDLIRRLEKLQEEANELAFAKTVAQAELVKKNKELSESEVSSEAQDRANQLQQEVSDLRADKKTEQLELLKQIESLKDELKQSKLSSSQSASMGDMQDQVDKLLRDLEKVTAEKVAGDKRLEWEKSNKRALRETIESLKEHADAASHAKKVAEDELRKLRSGSDTQTNSSVEDLAAQLRQQVKALQEEKEATLEQVKALEDTIASGEIHVGTAAKSREAYVMKLKRDIEMLENNVKHLSEENRTLLQSKGRSEGEMGVSREDSEQKFHSVNEKIQVLTDRTDTLKGKLRAALKEADDARLAEKEEKSQVLDLQARMDRTILQLATLKSSTRLNMERLREEHAEALKVAMESGAAEAFEELHMLRQSLEDEKAVAAEMGNERDMLQQQLEEEKAKAKEERGMLRQQLKAEKAKAREELGLRQQLEAEMAESRKRLETEIAARKAAEAALGSMHIDPKIKVTSETVQGSDPDDAAKLCNQVACLESEREAAEQIAEEAVAESEALSQKLEQAKKENEQAKKELRESNAKMKELQHSIEAIKTKEQISLGQAKKEAAATETKLKRRITFTEQAHAERIALHERQIDELRKEKDALAKELKHANQQKLLKRDATELLDEMESVKSKNESLGSQLKEMVEKNAVLTKELSGLNDQMKAMKENFEEKQGTARSQLEVLVETNQSLTKNLAESNDRITTLEDNNDRLREDRRRTEAECTVEIDSLKVECEKYRVLLHKKDEEIDGLLNKEQSNGELISIMKEQISGLQRENSNIEALLKDVRKKYDDEFAAMRKVDRDNSVLKSSIKQHGSTIERMQKELGEQKSGAAIARLEENWKRREEQLKEELYNERKQLQQTKAIVRDQQEHIQRLQTNPSSLQTVAYSGKREVSTELVLSSGLELDPLVLDLQEENVRLRSTLTSLENVAANSEVALPPDIVSSFQEERELRLKAEEIAASLARRAKASMERRNSEIHDLKMKLAAVQAGKRSLKDEGANGGKTSFFPWQEAHMLDAYEELEQLRPIVSHLKELYELKDKSFKELQVEGEKQKRELRKYKALAGKLHRQLAEIDHQLLDSGKK